MLEFNPREISAGVENIMIAGHFRVANFIPTHHEYVIPSTPMSVGKIWPICLLGMVARIILGHFDLPCGPQEFIALYVQTSECEVVAMETSTSPKVRSLSWISSK
jgi:hypothetical protein